jgi:glycosyltransferase involved in cell wall biosynthesis
MTAIPAGRPAVDQARVSIITPTLNQARYLEETLRSVAAQTYEPVEHLVVDGGSVDGTVELLRSWHHPRLRWLSEPDHGMYEAINRGLGMAHGEILGYLNSDDLYFPWTIEAVVAAFERDPSIDLVYGDALRLDEINGLLVPWLQPATSMRTTLNGGSLIQPTVFWRRRVSDDLGGFDAGLRLAGDLDFWLRAADSGRRFRRVDEFLAIDRAHPSTQSVNRSDALSQESKAIRAAHPGLGTERSARLRMRIARRILWARLALAIVSRPGRGWSPSIAALGPSISVTGLLLALLRGGSRSSRVLRWRLDPHRVAAGEPQGAPDSSGDRR